MTTREVWRPVVGYEVFYQVSNKGRVRSLDRVDRLGRHRKGKVLSDCDNGSGYRVVNLKYAGSQRMRTVHSLVMESFRGSCPAGKEVCHKDGKRAHNWLSNLRYGTRTSNHADKVRHGTMPRGSQSSSAKLTEAQVRKIVALLPRTPQRQIARTFRVHFATISAIATGKSWVHLTGMASKKSS